jgi:hypothetical protein
MTNRKASILQPMAQDFQSNHTVFRARHEQPQLRKSQKKLQRARGASSIATMALPLERFFFLQRTT